MKHNLIFLTVCLCLGIIPGIYGQTIKNISTVPNTIEEGTALPIVLQISPLDSSANSQDVFISVTVTGDCDPTDFSFEMDGAALSLTQARTKVTIPAGRKSISKTISITPVKDGKTELIEKAEIKFELFTSVNNSAPNFTTITTMVESAEKPTQDQMVETLKNYYPGTAINGLNVYLGGGIKLSGNEIFNSFAFETSLRDPDMYKGKKGIFKDVPFGIFAGIYKYSYSVGDSTKQINEEPPRLLNPHDTLTVGKSKIIRDTYESITTVQLSNVGAYLDLVWTVMKEDHFRFGVSLDVDLANSYSKNTITRNRLRSDTSLYSRGDSMDRIAIAKYPPILLDPIYKRSTNAYFGIGFPIMSSYEKAYDFFLHPIIGLTSFNPGNYEYGRPDFIKQNVNYRSFYPYYIVKAQITEKATGLGVTIGCESRGIFEFYGGKLQYYNPAFVLFVASKLDISKLVGK